MSRSDDPSAFARAAPGRQEQDVLARLRERAERLASLAGSADLAALSAEDAARLLHELQVHQIELEMQNEELRAALEQLEAARQRYFDLYDLAPAGYCTLSEDGLILEANLTLAALLGYGRADLVGTSLPRLVQASDQGAYYLFRTRVFRSRLAASCELRLRRKGRDSLWVRLDAAFAEGREGLPSCRISITDISATKLAEEALLEASQFKDEVISSVRDGIVVYGPDLRYRVWSASMERIFGIPASDVIGRHPLELFPFLAECGIFANVERALRGEWSEVMEVRYRLPQNGQEGWISDLTGPLRNSLGEVVGAIATVREITGRERIQAENARLEDQLRQAQKLESIGRLAGGVAHEFNNLLTIILGNCDLLLASTPAGSPARRPLGVIEQAGERAAELTRSLLAFGRRQMMRPRRLDLSQVVAGMQGMSRSLLDSQSELHYLLAPDLRPVFVDPGQVQQVLINLLLNARDAISGLGRIVVETWNAGPGRALPQGIPAGLLEDGVVLRVTDTGCGVDEATRLRMFEPFFTTKDVGSGTGLGLATVYGIVQQAGGWIGVESEPGKGCAITIVFPSIDGHAEAEPSDEPEEVPARGDQTILLVEEETEVRNLAATVLREQGYKVLEAGSGEEAIQIAEGCGPIHLLLTDIVLPRMMGPVAAKRLQQMRHGMKVLYISGYPKDVVEAFEASGENLDCLPKPFRPSELKRRVHAVLRSKSG